MDIAEHFEGVANQLGRKHITASFYPYTELKHTWMRDGDGIAFKISDYLDGAPDEVLESLAWYLLCRVLRRNCPDDRSRIYLDYVRSDDLWSRARTAYIGRAKNLILEPRGKHRDLSTVFAYVNSSYFAGKIPNPTLAWAQESPKGRLGFYFPPLRLLAVNSVFDSERVPRYALEFVVYHELLHHIDVLDGKPRRRVHHTKGFREQERLFSSSAEAEKWLRRLAAQGRPRSK